MRDLIILIFGQYTPVTFLQYNHYLDQYEEVVAPGFAGVDWPFVLGVLGFLLVVFCVFKIFGGIVKNAF